MTLKNKIKEAFKKRVDEEGKWNSKSHPNISELESFLKKSGYILVDVVHQGEGKKPELFIESSEPLFLHPEIYHDLVEDEFTIKVDKHGLVGASDMEEIIQGYENALAIIKHLNSLDLSKLESGEETE